MEEYKEADLPVYPKKRIRKKLDKIVTGEKVMMPKKPNILKRIISFFGKIYKIQHLARRVTLTMIVFIFILGTTFSIIDFKEGPLISNYLKFVDSFYPYLVVISGFVGLYGVVKKGGEVYSEIKNKTGGVK